MRFVAKPTRKSVQFAFLSSASCRRRIQFQQTRMTSMVNKFWTKVRRIAQCSTVEPVVYLNFVALSSLVVSEQTLLYRMVCVQQFQRYNSSVNCLAVHEDPVLEEKVQKGAASWTVILSFSYIVPSTIAANFLGAWSDRHGRKTSILLGLVGLIVTTVPDLALISYPEVPIMIMAISNAVAGLTGYVGAIVIASLAFLADSVVDKRTLAFRMTILSMCKSFGAMSGSFLLSAVTKRVSLATAIVVPVGILVLAFFYTLWRIPNYPPKRPGHQQQQQQLQQQALESTSNNNNNNNNNNETTPDEDLNHNNLAVVPKTDSSVVESKKHQQQQAPWSQRLRNGCGRALNMSKAVAVTLFRHRAHHRRTYILLSLGIYFCYIMSELGLQHGPILTLYVFHRPHNWSSSDLATYRGVQHAFELLGSGLTALAMRKFTDRLPETAVVLTALTSGFSFLMLTGFANKDWMLYAAAASGSFATVLVPAAKSFVTRQVEPDEVGKVLAASSITADLALVVTTLLFTNVYSLTLSTFAGAVFLLGASLVAVCFCVVFWMHIDSQRQRRRLDALSHQVPECRVISLSDSAMKCFN